MSEYSRTYKDDNIACQSKFGLGIFQPRNQNVQDKKEVANPYYDELEGITYISYGIITNCYESVIGSVGSVEFFYVPVCKNISLQNVLFVNQYLGGCTNESRLGYDFVDTDIAPPQGFKFLRINVDESFEEGGAGLFQIALAGKYAYKPVEDNNLFYIITTTRDQKFVYEGENFVFAGCVDQPDLTIVKKCRAITNKCKTYLLYNVTITNTGEKDLACVRFVDIVKYDGLNVDIGRVFVVPKNIRVNASQQGVIFLTGKFIGLDIGKSIDIRYLVPIISISKPGIYNFSNVAIAESCYTQAFSYCEIDLEYIELKIENCCLNDNKTLMEFDAIFTSLLGSPSVDILVKSKMLIPKGIVIEFTSFSNCKAFYEDSGREVELNTDVTDATIIIKCKELIPSNSIVTIPVKFKLVKIEDVSTLPQRIDYEVVEVKLADEESKILKVCDVPVSNFFTIDNFFGM